MKSSMPKPVRARWAPKRRRRQPTSPGEVQDGTVDDGSFVQAAEAAVASETEEMTNLTDIARALWQPDYRDWFNDEIERNRAALGRDIDAGRFVQPSRYARRLCGAAAEAWELKHLNRERDQLAIELHARNMRHWSPSMVARSIAYFNLTTSWMHQVESGQRRLASRPTTLKVMRLARDLRPESEWEAGLHVAAYAFDQTYEWVGMAKRGARQAVESVDATGMPMAITHEVLIAHSP